MGFRLVLSVTFNSWNSVGLTTADARYLCCS